LTLPMALTASLRLTPEQFAQLCDANPDAVLELAADGSLIPITPTGSETGARNGELFFQIKTWARARGGWMAFDSSTGFRLPDNSVLSPDASLVALARWQALSANERRGFAPLCPDLRPAWIWSLGLRAHKDAQLGEDAHRYVNRTGAPVLAVLRSIVMNLLRSGGYRSIRQGLWELTYAIKGILALCGVAPLHYKD